MRCSIFQKTFDFLNMLQHKQYSNVTATDMFLLLHMHLKLFDFDMESQPVLEVLVGKTIQHSLIEVLQEEDVADIKRQRRRFEQLRKAYLAGEKWLQEQVQYYNSFFFRNTSISVINGEIFLHFRKRNFSTDMMAIP